MAPYRVDMLYLKFPIGCSLLSGLGLSGLWLGGSWAWRIMGECIPIGTLGVLGFRVAPYRVEMLILKLPIGCYWLSGVGLSVHLAVGSFGCRVMGLSGEGVTPVRGYCGTRTGCGWVTSFLG